MDSLTEQTHDIETRSKIEEIRAKVATVDQYSRDECKNLANYFEDKYKEGGWIEDVLTLVGDTSDNTFTIWQVVREHLGPKDSLSLSAFLATEAVSGSTSRSVKDSLIKRLLDFSQEVPDQDKAAILEKLSRSQAILTELARRERSRSPHYFDLVKADLFSVAKARFVFGEQSAIDETINQEDEVIDDPLREQLSALKSIQNIDRVIRTNYVYRPIHDMGYSYDDYSDYYDDRRIEDDEYINNDLPDNDAEKVPQIVLQASGIVESRGFVMREGEKEELGEALEKVLSSKDGDTKIRLLHRILINQSSDEAKVHDFANPFTQSDLEIELLFSSKEMIDVISVLSKDTEKYIFPLAVLLSKTNVNLIPKETLDNIRVVTKDTEIRIKLEHEQWTLCSSGEPRLLNAIEDGAVLAVNDSLLVKFVGRLSAFCTKSFTTKEGNTFLKGCWYSPIDEITKNSLRESFDQGYGSTNIPYGEWLLVRGAMSTGEKSISEIMDVAIKSIDLCNKNEVPELIRGMSRIEYRMNNPEEIYY